MGRIATLRASALKGANGKVPVIQNAPSPLAMPKRSFRRPCCWRG